MAAIIQFSQNSAVTDGAFAPGARVSFFLTGTTTPVTVYTDEARTIPHPTPVVANASGQFPLIWGEDGVNLKAVVTASDGSAIDTYDPVILGNISARTAAGTSFAPIPGNTATDVQAALANVQNNKADLASPALTGVPLAPTAAAETDTTQIATTAFVRTGIAGRTGLTPYQVISSQSSGQILSLPDDMIAFDILIYDWTPSSSSAVIEFTFGDETGNDTATVEQGTCFRATQGGTNGIFTTTIPLQLNATTHGMSGNISVIRETPLTDATSRWTVSGNVGGVLPNGVSTTVGAVSMIGGRVTRDNVRSVNFAVGAGNVTGQWAIRWWR